MREKPEKKKKKKKKKTIWWGPGGEIFQKSREVIKLCPSPFFPSPWRKKMCGRYVKSCWNVVSELSTCTKTWLVIRGESMSKRNKIHLASVWHKDPPAVHISWPNSNAVLPPEKNSYITRPDKHGRAFHVPCKKWLLCTRTLDKSL